MPLPTALYQVSEIRDIEKSNLAALPAGALMRRAGHAAAHLAKQLISPSVGNTEILVLAGPGNNGGDALEAACLLANEGEQVTVLLCADPDRLSGDALHALKRARNSAATFAEGDPVATVNAKPWSLVIDGLFGIGLGRPITGTLQDLVNAVNRLACEILALDVPSGLNADTGSILGSDRTAIRATHTITFIADKPGLHTGNGRDYAGKVHVASIGIDDSSFKGTRIHLSNVDMFAPCMRRRPHNSHKGSYGDVAVVGGAHGMSGAVILAARAAAKCGAGRVFAAFIGDTPAYDSMQPELMCRRAQDIDFSAGMLVVGPGLGASQAAHEALSAALKHNAPLVLDADALNLIAAKPELQRMLAQRTGDAIMTPHPLEAARLLQTSAQEVQAERLHAARELAKRFDSVVILKGSGSVIARPDGELNINNTGNPALATAGTGDVLAGICGALLAQSYPAWEAAIAAAWLHGRAADNLVLQGIGPIGLTAGELIPAVRTLLNQLTEQYARRPASS
jgi:hydroxyethylthiazole kinase-like uncharacterized protein yjeF